MTPKLPHLCNMLILICLIAISLVNVSESCSVIQNGLNLNKSVCFVLGISATFQSTTSEFPFAAYEYIKIKLYSANIFPLVLHKCSMQSLAY